MARPFAESTWPQFFRTHKSSLRALLKNGDPTKVQPRGIDPELWKKFVENESDPKRKEINAKNSNNKKKQEFSHCLGRRTYAQKQYKMVCIKLVLLFNLTNFFSVANSLNLMYSNKKILENKFAAQINGWQGTSMMMELCWSLRKENM